MSGKIFLAGGGDENQSRRFDELFVKQLTGGKILYIPVAMDEESTHFSKCLEWFKKTFSELGVNNERITMITNLNDVTDKFLNSFKAVYIGGGNTFKLLSLIIKSGFNHKLINFYNNGGVIYGGSAGAIIMGKTIKTCERSDENLVKLKDTKGLNLIKGYSVWAHYKKQDNELIKKFAEENNEDLLIIPETSGVIIDDSFINCIGSVKLLNK